MNALTEPGGAAAAALLSSEDMELIRRAATR